MIYELVFFCTYKKIIRTKKSSESFLALAFGCVDFLYKRVCGRGPIPGVPFYIGPNLRTKKHSLDLRNYSRIPREFPFKCCQIGSDPVRSARMWSGLEKCFLYVDFGRFPEPRNRESVFDTLGKGFCTYKKYIRTKKIFPRSPRLVVFHWFYKGWGHFGPLFRPVFFKYVGLRNRIC